MLQLVERGTLSLADTVGKFLPEYPAPLKGLTIEQLLTHTAGVPNAPSVASLLAVGRGWLAADQVMATFKDLPLEFAPGTRWAYSNSGYQLLGYVVEKATEQPFPEYIEHTLLEPAAMTHSLWGNDMRVVPNRASPYLFTRTGIENAVNGNVQIAWAAGALQSTAEDFLEWHTALLTGRFVSRAMLERAWTPARLRDGTVTDYGYGGPKWALVPYAKDRLTFENTSTIGEMRRDAKGRIVAFAMQTLRGRSKNVITRVDVAPR